MTLLPQILAITLSLSTVATAWEQHLDYLRPQPSESSRSKAFLYGRVPELQSTDHVIGDRSAPVLLVVYIDLSCPACHQYHSVVQKVQEKNAQQVALVYRHYPIYSLNNGASVEAAEAAECIAKSNGDEAFYAFIDQIQSKKIRGSALNNSKFYSIAETIGANKESLGNCLEKDLTQAKVEKSYEDAWNAGIGSVPMTILISQDKRQRVLDGAESEKNLQSAIDELLKK